jgi:hypothetical protein
MAAEDDRQHQEAQHPDADDREAVAAEAPPGVPPRDLYGWLDPRISYR